MSYRKPRLIRVDYCENCPKLEAVDGTLCDAFVLNESRMHDISRDCPLEVDNQKLNFRCPKCQNLNLAVIRSDDWKKTVFQCDICHWAMTMEDEP